MTHKKSEIGDWTGSEALRPRTPILRAYTIGRVHGKNYARKRAHYILMGSKRFKRIKSALRRYSQQRIRQSL